MHTHLSPHLKLDNLDFVCYDWRLAALVKGTLQHLKRIGVKLVGKTGPFECEGHWLLVRGGNKASFIRCSCRKGWAQRKADGCMSRGSQLKYMRVVVQVQAGSRLARDSARRAVTGMTTLPPPRANLVLAAGT